jgi:hypothetical protein
MRCNNYLKNSCLPSAKEKKVLKIKDKDWQCMINLSLMQLFKELTEIKMD